MIKSFKDLIVWQKAMDLVVEVYQLSGNFPQTEIYSLMNQLRRAAVSIVSNIAEGKGRESRSEYFHFLSIAQGSLSETETQLLLATRLGYITEEKVKQSLLLIDEIGKMLHTIRKKLKDSCQVPNT